MILSRADKITEGEEHVDRREGRHGLEVVQHGSIAVRLSRGTCMSKGSGRTAEISKWDISLRDLLTSPTCSLSA